jgi:hypothetical protein
MLNKMSLTTAAVLLAAGMLTAQTRPAPTPPPEKTEEQGRPQPAPAATRAEAPKPEPPGQPINVKLELTISDQAGPGEPIKKVVSMIVSDRQSGFLRSRGAVRVGGRFEPVTINVDARPVLLRDNLVRVELGLEYQPRAAGDPATPGQPGTSGVPPLEPASSNLNQRIGVIVESGKPLVISQAADPASDRRITVELRATVIK